MTNENGPPLRIAEFPDVVMEHMLSYLSYDNIAKLRRVNKRFDMMCKYMLNRGFQAVEKYHAKCIKEVKSKLPRRESERREHPLARHNDILTAIETRISLLSMTFMKYIDMGMCCFIPGKVIDEIYTVLRNMKKVDCHSRSCEVLQELRDISSMAMEYFDEKIVPDLRSEFPGYSPVRLTNGSYLSSIFTSGSGFSLSMRYTDPVSPPSFSRLSVSSSSLHAAGSSSEPSLSRARSVVRDLTTPSRATSTTMSPPTTPTGRGARGSGGVSSVTRKARLKTARLLKNLKRQADDYKNAVESQNKKMLELDQRIDQQNEIINQQNARLVEQEEKLAEMSRRVAENETNNLTPGGGGGGGSSADGGKKSETSSADGGGAATEAQKISAVEGNGKEEISSVDKLPAATLKVGESSVASKAGKRTRSDECKEEDDVKLAKRKKTGGLTSVAT
eukprot:TRINITY_DN5791_c0_g1_i1.p1 TRINITY_DN5791_c0_g1~~TRINITY_DN5791_c0_g1_i1.p1  ORF type:complete len:447 (-),score=163.03 TRINITY_DN5791_c0_g1_i1:537-1877(-)